MSMMLRGVPMLRTHRNLNGQAGDCTHQSHRKHLRNNNLRRPLRRGAPVDWAAIDVAAAGLGREKKKKRAPRTGLAQLHRHKPSGSTQHHVRSVPIPETFVNKSGTHTF